VVLQQLELEQVSVEILPVQLVGESEASESELDEMWSFVQKKANQRWLWHAIDHATGVVLAYVLGEHNDDVFLKLKQLLEPFGINRFYTDGWGAYARHIEAEQHQVGKANTQKIERKHLTLRTRIKRLARRTLCFSKSEIVHDIVISLYINRHEFGVSV
jgi:insertion element IS1 protein InsB